MTALFSGMNERLKMLKVNLKLVQRDRKEVTRELLRRNEESLRKRYRNLNKIKGILDVLDHDHEDREYAQEAYDIACRRYLYYSARHDAMVQGKAPDEFDLKKLIETQTLLKDQ